MKISPFTSVWLGVFSFGAGLMTAQEPRSISSRSAPPRDHHLFVGANLFVTVDGQRVRVHKIKGSQVLVESPSLRYVPLKTTNGITFQMETKVSATLADIQDYSFEETFSTSTNPTAEQGRLQAFLGGQMDVVARNQSAIRTAVSDAASLAQNGSTSQVRAAAAASQSSMQGELNSLSEQMTNMANMQKSAMQDDQLLTDGENGGVTALRVSFRLSSPITIAEAYIFVAARIFADEAFFDVSFYRHIGKVTNEPRLIFVKQEGFPAGFETKETEIYLFSFGEEIPTNLSQNRYALTAQEAHEFTRTSHIADHRSGSAPAQPIWALSPAELYGSANPEDFAYSLRIDLDQSGQVLEIHDDGQIVPQKVKDLLLKMTFVPALENGIPSPSTITVNPADFYKD